jgi:hypothetical protein
MSHLRQQRLQYAAVRPIKLFRRWESFRQIGSGFRKTRCVLRMRMPPPLPYLAVYPFRGCFNLGVYVHFFPFA